MEAYPSLSRHPYGRPDDVRPSIYMEATPSAPEDKPPMDLQGEGLSFERDIQPLSKRFFAMSYGRIRNPNAAASAFSEADTQLKNAYLQNAQIRAVDEQSRNRRVEYESAVFALESARDKARKERELLTNLAPLQGELDSILSDPAKDHNTKQTLLSKLAIQNAGLISTQPAAAAAFNAARSGLVKDDSQVTVASYLNSGRGSSKFLSEYNEEFKLANGRDLQASDPLPPVRAFKAAEDDRVAYTKAKADEEERIKRDKERRANMGRALEYSDKIKFAKDPNDSTKTLDVLEKSNDAAVLDTILTNFATPEEIKQATTLRAKADLAARIRIEQLARPESRPLRELPPDTKTVTTSLFQ